MDIGPGILQHFFFFFLTFFFIDNVLYSVDCINSKGEISLHKMWYRQLRTSLCVIQLAININRHLCFLFITNWRIYSSQLYYWHCTTYWKMSSDKKLHYQCEIVQPHLRCYLTLYSDTLSSENITSSTKSNLVNFTPKIFHFVIGKIFYVVYNWASEKIVSKIK